MQTASKKVLKKNGRPLGSLGKTTIKKNAIRVLQKIMEDEGASQEARAIAAVKLIEEATK